MLPNENTQSADSLYASLFTNNHAIMLLIDPGTGAIIDANAAACHFYGYSHTELLNMNINQINTLTPEEVSQEMHRANCEERRRFFFEHRLSSGEIRNVEVFSGPVAVHNRPLLYSIVNDITDKRKAEQEIINLNRTLERKVRERTCQYQKANKQLEETNARLEETNARLEEEIAERMEIEQALQKSMAEIRDLYENAPCGYHSLDRDGRIIRINDTELSWLGYPREEVLGRKFMDFLTPESKEHYQKYLQEFFQRGWLTDLEFTIRHRDGTQRPIVLSATAIRDEQGTILMSRSTLYDMSLKKQAEDQLIQLNNELEEIVARRTAHLEETNAILEEEIVERTRVEKDLVLAKEQAENANIAKSNFLAHMSHEIRTPMTGMMGILQLLEMTELNEEQHHLIQVCMTSSELLSKVINDILDYSKIEDGKMELEKVTFHLPELIANLEMLFSPAALNKSIQLSVLIEDTVPEMLIGDPFKLRQVLSNLIGNAIKFTSQGRIDLAIRKAADEGAKDIKLEFSVKDTGIGISQDRMDVLFQSFSQADSSTTRKYGGTGLGLAICKGLTRKMKGDIWVESKENEGSTFSFTCILEKPEGEENTPRKEIPDPVIMPADKPLRLMVVEDDEIIRIVIEQFSLRKGWKVVLAKDGYEAIDSYQNQEFDIILMDCQMPGLDGYKTTEAIRKMEGQKLEGQKGRHTPIIAMTANALKGVREICLAAGMDDYLTKPVETGTFYAMIEKWAKISFK